MVLKFDSGSDGEVALEVGGGVSSRDGRKLVNISKVEWMWELKVESGDHLEVGLEVVGEVGSSDGGSVLKGVKGGFNVIIDYSVVWGVYIFIGAEVFKGVNIVVKVSKAGSNLWFHYRWTIWIKWWNFIWFVWYWKRCQWLCYIKFW